MTFKRIHLSCCISMAQKTNNKNIYCELLKILYRLLEQEQINGVIINDFYYYEPITEEAMLFYLSQL